MPVVIDLGRGVAQVADRTIAVAVAGPGAELAAGGPDGVRLRPLAFGVRSRLVALASHADDPRAGLARAITAASTSARGSAPLDETLVEILALHLAGAGNPAAAAFGAVELAVARAAGWTPDALAAAEAAEVDRLATALGVRSGEAPGWTRIVFGAPATGDPEDLDAVRADLADDLLRRGRGAALDVVDVEGEAAAVTAPAPGAAPRGPSALPPQDGATPAATRGLGHSDPATNAGTSAGDRASDASLVLRARFAPRARGARRFASGSAATGDAATSPGAPGAGGAALSPAATAAPGAAVGERSSAPAAPASAHGASRRAPIPFPRAAVPTDNGGWFAPLPSSIPFAVEDPAPIDPLPPAFALPRRPSARDAGAGGSHVAAGPLRPPHLDFEIDAGPAADLDPEETAAALAALLQDEADLRGLSP